MRRSLVLTREGFRHPMRMGIPHRRAAFADGQAVATAATTPVFDWRLTASDVRGFATTYFATVAAVFAFII